MELVKVQEETRDWVTFENEGDKLFGILHKPLHTLDDPPLVLVFHGFASHKVGTNRSYVKLAQSLAKEGIATLRFDFRGSGDSEGCFGDLTLSGLVSDALMALRFAESLEGIDSNRMGIMGSSFGGSIALLAGASYRSIKSLVVWAPVASGLHWLADYLAENPHVSQKEAAEALKTYRGVKVNSLFQQEFGKMDATIALEQLGHVPFLHLQGEADRTISLSHQKAFQKKRASAEAPSRFLTIPGAEHFLGLADDFPAIQQESVDWFKRHL